MRGNLLTQYLRVKAQYQDAILLFRLGDFYEMFFDDAREASSVLDLTLTARNRGEPDEVPLCGFPAHAAQPYVARLLAAGRTVAVCEQTPGKTRGLMDREVVRLITPGTILEEESLDPGAPSLLAAVIPANGAYGIAALDFATGTLRATDTVEWRSVRDEVERLMPRELLVSPELEPAQRDELVRGRPWAIGNLPPLPDTAAGAADRAVAAVLAYVDATFRRRPAHLREAERYQLAGHLTLDTATRRNLELFETLSGERRGSLLGVLDRTRTPMGARRLREWLLYPLLDPAAIGRRLDAVEAFYEAVDVRTRVREILAGTGDLARLAGRIGARTAGPRDLAGLAAALERAAELRAVLEPLSGALLRETREAIACLPELVDEVRRSLVDAPPPHTRVPGYVREGRHPEIDALRAAAQDGKGWIARFEAEERRRTGIATLKVRYNKVFGYYLEVTRANLGLVPPDYERKQTLVGAERFVTATLKEHEARVLGAEERLRHLEQHVFDELLEDVARHQLAVSRTADALATLDALASLAEVAHHRGWVRPRLTTEPRTRVRAGRHPVVEAIGDAPFVPNDVDLDADAAQVLVITGPNMGGKSTYLRQVALLTILAHAGSFVPASEAVIGITDRVFTRVGASDNLAGGESTFMVEMRETAHILTRLTPRSLVILDEIGRGTSTFDGISIARAVAEALHDAPERPRTLFATHYHELTDLARERPRVRNLSVAVAEWRGEIVFLRQIVPGPTSRSYGVEVAKLAGVPDAVVERARELLAALESGGTRQAPAGEAAKQLPLFAPPGERVLRELAALEPERLTPLEALGILARLVDEVRAAR
ncbi:MAG TPA: DNA mismatch repair protein MutS [Candidatus Limnocylindria bacterium]|nr:DNA mismatch repair protein MutS [Candidatus Limnocylindria bacterium]